MRIAAQWVMRVGLVAAMLTITGCDSEQPSQASTRIDVVRGGDTALDAEMQSIVETRFEHAPGFVVGVGSQQHRLLVIFEGNVRPALTDDRPVVRYQVTFRSLSHTILGTQKGECPRGNLDSCAREIVDGALRIRVLYGTTRE